MGFFGASIADPIVDRSQKHALLSASLLVGCAVLVMIVSIAQSGPTGGVGGFISLGVFISILVCQHQSAKGNDVCCAKSSCCCFGYCICWQVFTALMGLVGLIVASSVPEHFNCCDECTRYCALSAVGNEDAYEREDSLDAPSSVAGLFGMEEGPASAQCATDELQQQVDTCDNNCTRHCPFEDDSGTQTATGVMALLLALGMSICACFGCFNSRRVQMSVDSSQTVGKCEVVAVGLPVQAEPIGTPIA